MSATLAQVFETFGAESLDAHGVSAPQAKVWRAVRNCRTAALGGHCLACDDCGHREYVYHSCRNRHCPTCQTRAKEAWTQRRLAELLPVPYAHLVFTLPHALNALTAVHDRWVYDTLLAVVAETLLEFAGNPRWLGAEPAFTAILHTWTQDLRRHVHVHVLIACGGLDPAGDWVEPKRNSRFLFPVHALSRVFRAKCLDALDTARRRGTLPRDLSGGTTRVEPPPPGVAQARLGGVRQDLSSAARRKSWRTCPAIPTAPRFPMSGSWPSGKAKCSCGSGPTSPAARG